MPPSPADPSAGKSQASQRATEPPPGGPTAAEKEQLRSLLMAMRSKIFLSSSNLADEALKGSGQDYKVDHLADFGSDNQEQYVSLSLLEGETELLQAVDLALRKLDNLERVPYGLCQSCAEQEGDLDPETSAPWIPTGRLKAVPYALLCVPHQEEQEEG